MQERSVAMPLPLPACGRKAGSQRGVALFVVMVILLAVMLVGVAVMRSASVQQRLSGNFYDHEADFQVAEAAAGYVTRNLGSSLAHVVNCGTGGRVCTSNPFDDATLPAGAIQTLPAGTIATAPGDPSTPQYVVEYMGAYQTGGTGSTGSAAGRQYGAQGTTITQDFYRITVRSGDPSALNQNAGTILQIVVKQ